MTHNRDCPHHRYHITMVPTQQEVYAIKYTQLNSFTSSFLVDFFSVNWGQVMQGLAPPGYTGYTGQQGETGYTGPQGEIGDPGPMGRGDPGTLGLYISLYHKRKIFKCSHAHCLVIHFSNKSVRCNWRNRRNRTTR